MADIKFGHSYDTEDFDVLAYLEMVWGRPAFELNYPQKDLLDDFYEIFNSLNIPEGSKHLDFGAGPSIHTAIVTSNKCSQIVLTEYAGQNREIVMQWLKGEDIGFDWTHMFQYLAHKEGRSAAELEKRTKAAIKEILACDAQKESIFGVAQLPQFDVITSSFCLEAACPDQASYRQTIAQLASHVKPGGYLIQTGTLNQTKFEVNGKMFPSLPLTVEDTDAALNIARFEPAIWKFRKIEIELDTDCDAKDLFTYYAMRK